MARLRGRLGWTQDKLAVKISVDVRTIQKIEANGAVSRGVLERVAVAFSAAGQPCSYVDLTERRTVPSAVSAEQLIEALRRMVLQVQHGEPIGITDLDSALEAHVPRDSALVQRLRVGVSQRGWEALDLCARGKSETDTASALGYAQSDLKALLRHSVDRLVDNARSLQKVVG